MAKGYWPVTALAAAGFSFCGGRQQCGRGGGDGCRLWPMPLMAVKAAGGGLGRRVVATVDLDGYRSR